VTEFRLGAWRRGSNSANFYLTDRKPDARMQVTVRNSRLERWQAPMVFQLVTKETSGKFWSCFVGESGEGR
jgi:hypothetical protein